MYTNVNRTICCYAASDVCFLFIHKVNDVCFSNSRIPPSSVLFSQLYETSGLLFSYSKKYTAKLIG